MVGDDEALSYFRVNETTGAIFLTSSVLSDTRVQYKVIYMENKAWKQHGNLIPILKTANFFQIEHQRND